MGSSVVGTSVLSIAVRTAIALVIALVAAMIAPAPAQARHYYRHYGGNCYWGGCCPPGMTIQGGLCKPYQYGPWDYYGNRYYRYRYRYW